MTRSDHTKQRSMPYPVSCLRIILQSKFSLKLSLSGHLLNEFEVEYSNQQKSTRDTWPGQVRATHLYTIQKHTLQTFVIHFARWSVGKSWNLAKRGLRYRWRHKLFYSLQKGDSFSTSLRWCRLIDSYYNIKNTPPNYACAILNFWDAFQF